MNRKQRRATNARVVTAPARRARPNGSMMLQRDGRKRNRNRNRNRRGGVDALNPGIVRTMGSVALGVETRSATRFASRVEDGEDILILSGSFAAPFTLTDSTLGTYAILSVPLNPAYLVNQSTGALYQFGQLFEMFRFVRLTAQMYDLAGSTAVGEHALAYVADGFIANEAPTAFPSSPTGYGSLCTSETAVAGPVSAPIYADFSSSLDVSTWHYSDRTLAQSFPTSSGQAAAYRQENQGGLLMGIYDSGASNLVECLSVSFVVEFKQVMRSPFAPSLTVSQPRGPILHAPGPEEKEGVWKLSDDKTYFAFVKEASLSEEEKVDEPDYHCPELSQVFRQCQTDISTSSSLSSLRARDGSRR